MSIILFCWLKHSNLQISINKNIHLLCIYYLNFVFYSVFNKSKLKSVLLYATALYDQNVF